MRKQACQILLSLACLFCVLVGSSRGEVEVGVAHPYHVSMAEVNWNAKTRKFEVALCVWPADLEKALGQQEGRTIDLAKEPNVDQMMEAYVVRRFFLRADPATPKKVVKENATGSADGLSRLEKNSSTQPKEGSPNSKSAIAHDAAAKAEAANWLVAAEKTSDGSDENRGANRSNGQINPKSQVDSKDQVDSKPQISKAKPSSAAKRNSDGGVRTDRAKRAIKWYGHEADPKQAWLYFELDGELEGKLTFENRVFFELNDDQLNHIQWAGSGKPETLVVSPDTPRVTLATGGLKQSTASQAVGGKEFAQPSVK